MLEQAREDGERLTHQPTPSSVIEQEVLARLRRPATYPPSVEQIIRELLSSFSELQIQKAISSLLKNGSIEVVLSRKHKLGFVLIPSMMKREKELKQ